LTLPLHSYPIKKAMQNFSNLGFVCKLLTSVFLIKPRQNRGFALHRIVWYILLCRRRAFWQAPYFALNSGASQGRQDKPATAKL
jgi:hypothetical protein